MRQAGGWPRRGSTVPTEAQGSTWPPSSCTGHEPLTGQMRQPDLVPGVRNVKHGAVPWAKAGLLVRRSLQQGTSYAAVMITISAPLAYLMLEQSRRIRRR